MIKGSEGIDHKLEATLFLGGYMQVVLQGSVPAFLASQRYMSCSLNSLRGVIQGIILGSSIIRAGLLRGILGG